MSMGSHQLQPPPPPPAAALYEQMRRKVAAGLLQPEPEALLARYQLDPQRYIVEQLGWTPWAGELEQPGQVEILQAYTAALQAQLDHPDLPCQNRIRIEAGHTVGKTKLAAGIVNHFFDTFRPAICYTYAPSWEQIHDLLWKEIKSDRRGRGLPGRILDLELKLSDNHFAKGRATNNSQGQGTERLQGQHGPFLLFVLDEAEGIDSYVWDAVESMTSGGLSIVLMLANPRTRLSRFHQAAADPRVVSFRLSCLYHPNVIHNQERIPGAVKRAYVDAMVEQHAEIVSEHDPDRHTFELPWQPGTIYAPDGELLFRVLGIAPAFVADNTLVPPGRYEAAKTRQASGVQPHRARFGIDVARFGTDYGTLYCSHAGALYRVAQFAQLDTNAYARAAREEALRLAARGVTSLHIRIDAGGGYGGGVADKLSTDAELAWAIPDLEIQEVHFNGVPYDTQAYADTATEIYAHLAEGLKVLALLDPPGSLEGDLCERLYRWVSARGVEVKELEPKAAFKKRMKRSPDDGDGAALAAAPDHIILSAGKPWDKESMQALGSRRKV